MIDKTLIDGRVVASDSEEWRLECEAREVLRWPISKRKNYLYGHRDAQGRWHAGVKGRGEEALIQLELFIQALWVDKKAREFLSLDEDALYDQFMIIQTNNSFTIRAQVEERMRQLNAGNL